MLRTTRLKEMTRPQCLDRIGWNNAISTGFHIPSIPTIRLVNSKGVPAIPDARAGLDGQIASSPRPAALGARDSDRAS